MLDETFDAWLIDLRRLANSCGYGASLDSVLRDQIVLGINNPLVREKLLYEKDLLLDKACEIAWACESSKAQLTQINTSSAADNAYALQSRHVDRKPARKTEPQPVVGHRLSQSHFAADNQQYTRCSNCGRRHRKNQCHATNVRCFGCGVVRHVSSCCHSSSNNRQMSAQEQPNTAARVHTIEGEPLWIGNVGDCGTAMAPPRSSLRILFRVTRA